MLRKQVVATICGLAAVGLLGVGAGSAAAADPVAECTNLPKGVNKFHMWTDPQTAEKPADVYGGGILCGSDFGGGKELGFKSGTIYTPMHVKVRCANPKNPNACTSESDLASGRYIGDVTMEIELIMGGSAIPLKGLHTKMYVDQAPATAFGSHTNTDCTATAIACYQGVDDLGTATANVIIKKASNNKLALKINQAVPFLEGVKVYYLKIGGTQKGDPNDMHLCANAGPVNGSACGANANDWVQKNGPAKTYACDYASLFFENIFAGIWSKKAKGLTGYWAMTDPWYPPEVPSGNDPEAAKAFLLSQAPNCATVTWK